MAKSTITLADEAADALLVKPQKKPSNLKGILAVAAVAFALGLAATTVLADDGNGAPSGPNCTLFSGVDWLLEASRGRSGSG